MASSPKWVARVIYGLVLTVLVGVAWWGFRAEAPPPFPVAGKVPSSTPTPTPAPSRPPPPPPREEFDPPARGVIEAPPPPEPAPAPTAVTPPAPGGVTPRLPNHPVDSDALSRESALIERARTEAKAEPEVALKTLVEHRRTFPAGVLFRDAELVHLEALLRLNRRPEAENLGRKLIAREGPAVRKSVEHLLQDVRPR